VLALRLKNRGTGNGEVFGTSRPIGSECGDDLIVPPHPIRAGRSLAYQHGALLSHNHVSGELDLAVVSQFLGSV